MKKIVRVGYVVCMCTFGAAVALAAPKDSTFKRWSYFRVGFDAASLAGSLLNPDFARFEIQVDSRYKKDLYAVFETGLGRCFWQNTYLTSSASNQFIRVGVDKTFFGLERAQDLDNAFVGIRYALSRVARNASTYLIQDPVWGTAEGSIPAKTFLAHWLELTAGFRFEIRPNLFAGWQVRARTFINPKRFEELPPAYLAGYGRGDRNTTFGLQFYISYGIGRRK